MITEESKQRTEECLEKLNKTIDVGYGIDFYNEDFYNNYISKKGLVVERIPVYWNDKVVNEEINVNLHYIKSDYESRKAMYKKILKDLEEVTRILKNSIKEID